MSDLLSDDTNHLLLIPPDFFMADLANVSDVDTTEELGSSVSKHAAYRPMTTAGASEARHRHQYHYSQLPPPANSFAADSSFRSYYPAAAASMFHHSTPKVLAAEQSPAAKPAQSSLGVTARTEDTRVIGEIDRFLGRGQPAHSDRHEQPPIHTKLSPEETLREFRQKCTLNGDSTTQRNLFATAAGTNTATAEPLLSLSAIWGRLDEQPSHLRPDAAASLQEERMRRSHCEHTIQQLQQALLERDQRIAIAISVDRRKDEAIAQLKAAQAQALRDKEALQHSLDRAVQRFADEHQLIDGKCAQLRSDNERLQRDCAQSQTSQRHLSECNELLEQKISHVTKAAAEVRSAQQQQIAELEVRLRNSEHSAEMTTAEVARLRAHSESLAGDVQRVSAEAAAKAEQWQQKEQTLLQEMDTQRASLKTFYQEQLNETVGRKLADFQQQVDVVETTLRSEARQRERLIAERAMRQMELIVQKNEQECALLSEKYSAEIELHRIQLRNASKTIGMLTAKVESFQAKRTDMAERLHTVMETQWQRALEILASPTTAQTAKNSNGGGQSGEPATENGTLDTHLTKAESENFSTPTGNRSNRVRSALPNENGNNDPLQHYIDMLLEKSPRDVEQVKDMLGTHKSQLKPDAEDRRSSAVNGRSKIQPWK